MPSLTDQLNGTTKRVKALENTNLKNVNAVARINKFYGDVKITVVLKVRTHTYNVCGAPGVVCGRVVL